MNGKTAPMSDINDAIEAMRTRETDDGHIFTVERLRDVLEAAQAFLAWTRPDATQPYDPALRTALETAVREAVG